MNLLVKIKDRTDSKIYSINEKCSASYIENLFLKIEKADVSSLTTAEDFLKKEQCCFETVLDPDIAAFGLIPYIYDIQEKTLYRNEMPVSREGAEYVGKIVHHFPEEVMYFIDKDTFFHTISEDSNIYSPSEFDFSAISLDPEIRKIRDDYSYNFIGEENPHTLEEYKAADLDTMIIKREKELRAGKIHNMLYTRKYADAYYDFQWIRDAVINDTDKEVDQIKELYDMIDILGKPQDKDLLDLIRITFRDSPVFLDEKENGTISDDRELTEEDTER